MFEAAEIAQKLDKETYRKRLPELRAGLLEAQLELVRSAHCPVLVLLSGMDGAGRGELANVLTEWMDPRHVDTYGMGDPTAPEHERPEIWRFWRVLPPKGRIALFLGSWYTWPLLDRAYGRIKRAELIERMEENARFEKMLVDEGVLLLKFWLHLSRKQQRKRLRTLEGDPHTRWRVTRRDWRHHERYPRFHEGAETALRITHSAGAPWLIVSGVDRNYRHLTVGGVIHQALRERLAARANGAPAALPAPAPSVDNRHVLRSLRLERKLDKSAYREALEAWQGKLNLLSRDPRFKRRAVAIVFEGNDAAGKGGAIRRVTGALDARLHQVIPVAAPSDEERARPYLWRFWRRIPQPGRIAIFDRSWYGRVLVERVEGFCAPHDWLRAYGEINDFEAQLARHGCEVVKFWLAISKEEQLRRFRERQSTEFKRFKITREDWRNRRQWHPYEAAICDMVERTGSEIAPWTLVEANNKYFARIKILKTLCARLEQALAKT